LQLLEPENLKDQGGRARGKKDRGDQNPILQAYGVSITIAIGHWTGLPLTGRTGKANAVNTTLWGGDAPPHMLDRIDHSFELPATLARHGAPGASARRYRPLKRVRSARLAAAVSTAALRDAA
jgi:hypothetical protein